MATRLLMLSLALAACYAHAQPVQPWDPDARIKPVPPALGGYCPVSLRDRQEWQPGEERISAFFDGQRYQFATTRERDIFTAAPQSYAPMLGGDCPVTFVESGQRVRAPLEHGVLHGGRLVFLAGDHELRYFLERPADFGQVDLALGGQCIVSRRDLGKDVAGIPETVVIHRGLRHWFASAHDRSLFLKNPVRYDGTGGDGDEKLEPHRPRLADTGETAPGETTPWSHPGAPKGDETTPLGGGEQDVILGALPSIAGYCPVTLRRDGAWVRGRYDYRVELGDLVFLTAGPKERETLRTDPATYVPAFNGDCAVSFLARGERIRGSVYHAFEYDGRLFLFADAERKAAFKASPDQYKSVDWAAGGMCVVTRADEGREAPGLADQATWHQGKLYRFAGPGQKQRFLATPEKYAVK